MKTVHVSGKRKRAIARATLKKGTGKVRINSLLLDGYTPSIAQMMIQEAIMLAGNEASKVDININVHGGGWHSQAEAARLVVAKALVEHTGSDELKKTYLNYDRNLLVQDSRRTEPCKPNDSKARAKRQKSYR
jgi:small subunit ribosomal protein S9